MRVFVKDLLRRVTVMDIPVDNQDLVQFQFESQLLGGDGDRVEETESHGLRALRVVARRTHNRQTILQFAGCYFEC